MYVCSNCDTAHINKSAYQNHLQICKKRPVHVEHVEVASDDSTPILPLPSLPTRSIPSSLRSSINSHSIRGTIQLVSDRGRGDREDERGERRDRGGNRRDDWRESRRESRNDRESRRESRRTDGRDRETEQRLRSKVRKYHDELKKRSEMFRVETEKLHTHYQTQIQELKRQYGEGEAKRQSNETSRLTDVVDILKDQLRNLNKDRERMRTEMAKLLESHLQTKREMKKEYEEKRNEELKGLKDEWRKKFQEKLEEKVTEVKNEIEERKQKEFAEEKKTLVDNHSRLIANFKQQSLFQLNSMTEELNKYKAYVANSDSDRESKLKKMETSLNSIHAIELKQILKTCEHRIIMKEAEHKRDLERLELEYSNKIVNLDRTNTGLFTASNSNEKRLKLLRDQSTQLHEEVNRINNELAEERKVLKAEKGVNSMLTGKVKHQQREIAVLKQHNNSLTNELKVEKERVEKARASIVAVKKGVDAMKRNMNALTRQLEKEKEGKNILTRDIERMRKEQTSERERLLKLREEVKQKDVSLSSLAAKNINLTSKITLLQTQQRFAEEREEKDKEDYSTLQKEVVQHRKEKGRHAQQVEEIRMLRNDVEQKDKMLSQVRGIQESILGENKQLRTELKNIRHMGYANQIKLLQDDVEAKEKDRDVYISQLKVMEADNRRMRKKLCDYNIIKERIADIVRERDSLQKDHDNITRLLNETKNENSELMRVVASTNYNRKLNHMNECLSHIREVLSRGDKVIALTLPTFSTDLPSSVPSSSFLLDNVDKKELEAELGEDVSASLNAPPNLQTSLIKTFGTVEEERDEEK